MNDFYKMLEEVDVDLETLNEYIESEEFIKAAGKVEDDFNTNYYMYHSDIEGFGIFSSNILEKGDVIGYGSKDKVRTYAGRYTNHSLNHNAKFYYFKDNDDIILIAEKRIDKGEEIVVNYRHHTYNKDYV
mgnify:CR=1 FL=1|tara:strand:- start:3314 stop:3703 length:390 start_codon:yes stop_codon:yes gene_type:complete